MPNFASHAMTAYIVCVSPVLTPCRSSLCTVAGASMLTLSGPTGQLAALCYRVQNGIPRARITIPGCSTIAGRYPQQQTASAARIYKLKESHSKHQQPMQKNTLFCGQCIKWIWRPNTPARITRMLLQRSAAWEPGKALDSFVNRCAWLGNTGRGPKAAVCRDKTTLMCAASQQRSHGS